MPIDFPSAPSLNQVYTYLSRSWIWNGSGWANNSVAGVGGGGGGATLAIDNATNATYYPTLSSTTSGSFSTANIATTKLYFNPSTGILSSVGFTSLSDVKFKQNILSIESALDTVNKLRGVSYNWKNVNNNIKSYGVIAQELEAIIPDLVHSSKQGLKSVNYDGLIGFLIKAIQELDLKIKTLELNQKS